MPVTDRGAAVAPAIPAFDRPADNRRLLLTQRPAGHPLPADLVRDVVPRPSAGEGQLLVRNLYLSADPVQRGWAVSLPLGSVMRALAVGIVIETRHPAYAEGDLVYGFFGWQDYAVAVPGDILSHVPSPRLPASAYAGAAGMTGVTAWLALSGIAPPRAGQTVLVTTAAGGVGSIVGQLVARTGATAIGLTGSDDKVRRCIDRFGYAAAADYHVDDVGALLDGLAPDGFDTFFDNTGGPLLDHAIRRMRPRGRIIQCGTAATPSWSPPPAGWRNEREVLTRQLTWSGFVIFDHADEFPGAVEALTDLVLADELRFDEDIDQGFDAVAGSLDAVFRGVNRGKKLVFIGADRTH